MFCLWLFCSQVLILIIGFNMIKLNDLLFDFFLFLLFVFGSSKASPQLKIITVVLLIVMLCNNGKCLFIKLRTERFARFWSVRFSLNYMLFYWRKISFLYSNNTVRVEKCTDTSNSVSCMYCILKYMLFIATK